ncbi:MAG: hypothetical protein VKK04_13185 [Synechococcales bacterium]|nr:hypothetical protein [Synechococcales bacterium]
MSTFSRADGVFQGEDGLVVIEIESAPAMGGWVVQDEYDGFTGSGYYRYSSNRVITGPGRDILSYTVNLDEPGTYFLTLHAFRNPAGEGREAGSDQENDFWVRVNGGEWEKIVFYTNRNDPDAWVWATSIGGDTRERNEDGSFPRASYENLEAGINVIEISGRSANVMVDRIHFSTERPNRDLEEPASRLADDVVIPQAPTTSGIADVVVVDRAADTVIDLFAAFEDAEDADADLVYTITDNTNPALVSFAITPTSGQLTLSYGTVAAGGNADLTVQATDTDGMSVATTFRVTVPAVQDDPVDTPDPPDTPDAPDTPDTPDTPDNPDGGDDGAGTPPATPGTPGTGSPNPPIDSGSTPPEGNGAPPGSGNTAPPPVASPDASPPPSEPVLTPSIILGTPQRDRLVGTQRGDEIRGFNQRDVMAGGAGDDIIFGGRGSDRLKGNDGNDALYGEAGSDRLIGGQGDDLLDGGRGKTTARGGGGCDTFVLTRGSGLMMIRDFKDCDRLGLSKGIRFNQLDIVQQGRNTLISLGNDPLAVLQRVDADDLTRRDFAAVN